MIKKLKYLVILLLISYNSFSNHLFTSRLTYEKINEFDYIFKLELVTDLYSNDTTNIGLNVMSYNSSVILNQIIMSVSKVDTIFCNYKKFTFKDTVNLPYGEWIVFFRKSFRADVINLQNSYFSTLYNELYIKNSKGLLNNSPTFNNEPIINICTGDIQLYPFLIKDSEKDSFSFEIETVKDFTNRSIPFFSTYNLINPIGADYFNLNNDNGNLTIITNKIGKFLLTIKIKEYRKGDLISFYNQDLYLDVRNCQDYILPDINQDYYEFCINDSFNVIVETVGGNSLSLSLYSNNNLNIDSNILTGLMNSEKFIYVNIIDRINLPISPNLGYHYLYNNFKIINISFKNKNLCDFRIININTSIRKQTIIYNLTGQIIFTGDDDFTNIVKELPIEYNNNILFYRIFNTSENKPIEQGIFIKQ